MPIILELWEADAGRSRVPGQLELNQTLFKIIFLKALICSF
jgi:hypothetical protein